MTKTRMSFKNIDTVIIEYENIHELTVTEFLNYAVSYMKSDRCNLNPDPTSFYYIDLHEKNYINESDQLFCKKYTRYFNMGIYFDMLQTIDEPQI